MWAKSMLCENTVITFSLNAKYFLVFYARIIKETFFEHFSPVLVCQLLCASIQGHSECYECTPPPATKTFPGCTIRNTPSQPIHCIVWAKHLFNQLYGEPDADNDVSPEIEDEGEEGATKGE